MKNATLIAGASTCMFLVGCGGSKPRGTSRPIDPNTGEEIVNIATEAASYFSYTGIALVLVGILLIVFLKMVKTGGMSIIAGFACFGVAILLNLIGAHLKIFIISGMGFTAVVGFMYFKAVTTCVPWLEKLANKDLNRDGHIGSGRHSEPTPQNINPAQVLDTALEERPDYAHG